MLTAARIRSAAGNKIINLVFFLLTQFLHLAAARPPAAPQWPFHPPRRLISSLLLLHQQQPSDGHNTQRPGPSHNIPNEGTTGNSAGVHSLGLIKHVTCVEHGMTSLLYPTGSAISVMLITATLITATITTAMLATGPSGSRGSSPRRSRPSG